MKTIFKSLMGSRLYGCDIPSSDYDNKGIFLEDLTDLLDKKPNVFRDNSVVNIEEEMYCLSYFMKLLQSGNTIPVEMLFIPETYWLETSKQWEEIVANRSKIVSSNIYPFIAYAKTQAEKYGFKGEKLTTIKNATLIVNTGLTFDGLCSYFKDQPGIGFNTEITRSTKPIRHIVICGKSFGETTNQKLWLEPLFKMLKTYGKRAQEATEGIDLKAQYHSVRLMNEAIELFTTGFITFPRPEANLLLEIRNGNYDKKAAETLIDTTYNKLLKVKEASTLQSKPDINLMNELVYKFQADYMREELNK